MVKFLKNSNGSIAVFVLYTMMFILIVTFGVFSLSIKKLEFQYEILEQTKEIYNNENYKKVTKL